MDPNLKRVCNYGVSQKFVVLCLTLSFIYARRYASRCVSSFCDRLIFFVEFKSVEVIELLSADREELFYKMKHHFSLELL
jgi:hypothetical protein